MSSSAVLFVLGDMACNVSVNYHQQSQNNSEYVMQFSAIGLIIVVNVGDDDITVMNFGRKSTVERGLPLV